MLAGIGNYVTLKILSCVASVKQMDSYQEVAYNISNSNRGYIFLISSAKFIFMAVTVSLNIDYCASYLASLFLLNSDLDSASSYGVYVAGVLITTIILVVPYWKLRLAHQQREKLALPAFVFAGCFLPLILINISLIIAAVGTSVDEDKPTTFWFSQQVQNNGAWPNPSDTNICSSSQTLIGYVPALFYSNMFSIIFLQIKAKTKISSTKDDKDYRLGLYVVAAVFLAAFCFYVPFFIGSMLIK